MKWLIAFLILVALLWWLARCLLKFLADFEDVEETLEDANERRREIDE